MPSISTIKISKETKLRLEKFKEHRSESFEDIIKKMLYVINILRKNPEKSRNILIGIEKSKRKIMQYSKTVLSNSN